MFLFHPCIQLCLNHESIPPMSFSFIHTVVLLNVIHFIPCEKFHPFQFYRKQSISSNFIHVITFVHNEFDCIDIMNLISSIKLIFILCFICVFNFMYMVNFMSPMDLEGLMHVVWRVLSNSSFSSFSWNSSKSLMVKWPNFIQVHQFSFTWFKFAQ